VELAVRSLTALAVVAAVTAVVVGDGGDGGDELAAAVAEADHPEEAARPAPQCRYSTTRQRQT